MQVLLRCAVGEEGPPVAVVVVVVALQRSTALWCRPAGPLLVVVLLLLVVLVLSTQAPRRVRSSPSAAGLSLFPRSSLSSPRQSLSTLPVLVQQQQQQQPVQSQSLVQPACSASSGTDDSTTLSQRRRLCPRRLRGHARPVASASSLPPSFHWSSYACRRCLSSLRRNLLVAPPFSPHKRVSRLQQHPHASHGLLKTERGVA